MTYTVAKDFTFAAAHFIRGHQGGCQNLHGHNYRVRIHVAAEELDELGMVVDFAEIKRGAQELLGPFDHAVINEIPPFDVLNTTAELLAGHLLERFAQQLDDARVRVVRIDVWETDTSCATATR
jgi:6-pyruvoyltetrahydropterin/6-carboxytetrahydropterin synthase